MFIAPLPSIIPSSFRSEMSRTVHSMKSKYVFFFKRNLKLLQARCEHSLNVDLRVSVSHELLTFRS